RSWMCMSESQPSTSCAVVVGTMVNPGSSKTSRNTRVSPAQIWFLSAMRFSLVVLDQLDGSVEALEASDVEGPAGNTIGRLIYEREPEPRIVLFDESVLGGRTVDALDKGEAPLAGPVHEIVADELLHTAIENATAHQPLVDDEPSALADAAYDADETVVPEAVGKPHVDADPVEILHAGLDLRTGQPQRR